MSTPTTARGALLRRAGTLLVAAALVGAPATSAFADPTASPTVSPTADASPTASASATPSPSATATGEPTPTTSPSATTPSPTSPAPSPSASGSPTAPAATPSAPPTTFLKGASASVLAQAASAATPQTAYAADFIARTLADGDDHYVFPDSGGFPDVGNTIDAILALDGAGAGSDQADASFAFVEDNVSNYMGADFDSTFAGPTAKALLAVLAQGGDPTSFGGIDLLGELQATEGAVEPGRFSDLPVDCGFDQCDFSNTIGQSLAVIALIRAGEPVSTASVDFLLAQQCADGGFRNDMDADVCTSDADATAFAAQALIAAESDAAANEALDHLAAVQLGNGALESADGVANANTTGLAAQAFAAGARDAELVDAQAFLVSLQYGCSLPPVLRGGLAFSGADRSTTVPSDEDLRATPQATLGLSGQSLLSVAWSEGASAGTTPTPCATTPAPTSTVAPTSSGAPTEGAGGSDPSAPVDSSATGSLAQTGTDLLAPAMLGLLLVVVGGLAVWATSRRRGAHA